MQQIKDTRSVDRFWRVETSSGLGRLLKNLHAEATVTPTAAAEPIESSAAASAPVDGYEQMRRRQRENAGS